MAFDYSKLRGRVIEKFGSMKEFAKACGISAVAMSGKFNGKIAISPDDIVKWSSPELLDIPAIEYHEYFFKEKVHETQTAKGA